MKKIGVVGHGFVGQAVENAFRKDFCEVLIADPKYDTCVDDVTECGVVFVCVPTPMGDDGEVDASIVVDVVEELLIYSDCTIVIKSTVTPMHLEQFASNSRVIYNPEFLTEANAKDDFINAKFHVLGGDLTKCMELEYLYKVFSHCSIDAKFFIMSMIEASFVKYGINTFLATKVTFFNQLKDECDKWNANFDTVRGAIGGDRRIGRSHTQVPGPDGKRGFGGACFPKDTAALLHHSAYDMSILESVLTINKSYRKVYELDEREKQMNINFGDD